MSTVKIENLEKTLEKSVLINILGGISLLDANLSTRYGSAQRTASRTNDYGKYNLLVLGLTTFGYAG